MIREILSLPEPERTQRLEQLSESKAFKVYSPKSFPVKFCGGIDKVEKGENLCSKSFALYLLAKYPELSEEPLEGPAPDPESLHSPYFDKLVAIKGIGEKVAEDIEKEYSTPEELIEAVKSDRLPSTLSRFKNTFLEVFK
ncbi:MAG: hypothetical protein U5N56_00095 [Candidatus Marinimicrobia bacterium]|nr:hypothetical protein [Candidatus Neomarinimicrobiota bacterium]